MTEAKLAFVLTMQMCKRGLEDAAKEKFVGSSTCWKKKTGIGPLQHFVILFEMKCSVWIIPNLGAGGAIS